MTAIQWQQQDVTLQVRVQPRASRNQVTGLHGDRLKIALTAPPVDGAANEALREFLAKELALPKSQIQILRGESSREKTLRLTAADSPMVRQKLQEWLS
ncbi:MAG: YggU family protein [Magnetococcales bacterium]|nr:YggU family protein [Magnetococcales bacterium]NGZ26452.1 YggU family protein [Magnetococcales bacterium]